MAKGVVVVYYSRLGGRLSRHQEILLEADARVLAQLMQYEFGGTHPSAVTDSGNIFFVPDDTLLLDEARSLGIRGPHNLYGGIVPFPFVKTKSIAHPLVDDRAKRPEGWSSAFAERVRDVVLRGYTVFSARDARIAAERMLDRGTVRLKRPLGASGKGQELIKTVSELDTFLEQFSAEEMDTYGLVLEENLRDVTTLSVGHIAVGALTVSYHGTQSTTKDNDDQSIYGRSDLMCIRGGWEALERFARTSSKVRTGVAQSKLYDEAMIEYPDFIASRRNYDVAQGMDSRGQRRSGVLESSWRVGGATSAELVAMKMFTEDPSLQVVEASHVQVFGKKVDAPDGAIIHFEGNDSDAGPMIRYTIVNRTQN